MSLSKIEELPDLPEYSKIILLLHDKRILCSDDSEVSIFDIKKRPFEKIELIKQYDITDIIQLSNTNLVFVHENRIIIYKENYPTYRGHRTLVENKNDNVRFIKAVELSKNRIAVISGLTIIIWSTTEPYNKIATLTGHANYVLTIMQPKGREMLISASEDCSISFWNLKTYQCESIYGLIETEDGKRMIQIDDNRVLFFSNRIYIINLNSYSIEKVFYIRLCIDVIKLDDDTILFYGNNFYFYDCRTKTLKGDHSIHFSYSILNVVKLSEKLLLANVGREFYLIKYNTCKNNKGKKINLEKTKKMENINNESNIEKKDENFSIGTTSYEIVSSK